MFIFTFFFFHQLCIFLFLGPWISVLGSRILKSWVLKSWVVLDYAKFKYLNTLQLNCIKHYNNRSFFILPGEKSHVFSVWINKIKLMIIFWNRLISWIMESSYKSSLSQKFLNLTFSCFAHFYFPLDVCCFCICCILVFPLTNFL